MCRSGVEFRDQLDLVVSAHREHGWHLDAIGRGIAATGGEVESNRAFLLPTCDQGERILGKDVNEKWYRDACRLGGGKRFVAIGVGSEE